MKLPKQSEPIHINQVYTNSQKQTGITVSAPNCYSARKCGGKVLNHKDQHNCKNSGGKSWDDGRGGGCVNNL